MVIQGDIVKVNQRFKYLHLNEILRKHLDFGLKKCYTYIIERTEVRQWEFI